MFVFKLDFVNDKQEKCRIVFASMEEQHGSDVRSIRRKVVDSLLPDVSQWINTLFFVNYL